MLACDTDVRWYRAFTPREAECVGLVLDGLSYEAIAKALGCSENTVQMHIVNAAGKLAECGAAPSAMRPKERVLFWAAWVALSPQGPQLPPRIRSRG